LIILESLKELIEYIHEQFTVLLTYFPFTVCQDIISRLWLNILNVIKSSFNTPLSLLQISLIDYFYSSAHRICFDIESTINKEEILEEYFKIFQIDTEEYKDYYNNIPLDPILPRINENLINPTKEDWWLLDISIISLNHDESPLSHRKRTPPKKSSTLRHKHLTKTREINEEPEKVTIHSSSYRFSLDTDILTVEPNLGSRSQPPHEQSSPTQKSTETKLSPVKRSKKKNISG